MWQEQFTNKLAQYQQAQISIDGQVWTARANQDGGFAFTNGFGREEKFSTADRIVNAIDSWYENPMIIVL